MIDSFEKVLINLKQRRERVLEGKYNCIPNPFNRFRYIFPGTEKSKYVIITANQKIGKSKLADYMYIYEPLFFMMTNPNVKVKVLYFTLEMSPEDKKLEFISHLLWRIDNIIISPTDLKSVNNKNPVPQKILDLLETEKYQMYLRKFDEMVTFIDNERNPTGINKVCRDYALKHGHLNFKTIQSVNSVTGEEESKQIIDPDEPYTPDDEDLYKIIIVDNASNLMSEKGLNKMQTIDKLSKYAITLKNQLQYVFVLIQHQAQAQEGIENIKLGRMFPTSDGLADCKTTSRDANIVIGLYSPFKFNLDVYEKYNIKKLRNYSRFLIMIEDRDYGSGGSICPLFFNGASSTFAELPPNTDVNSLNRVYEYIYAIEKEKRDRIVNTNTFISHIKPLRKKIVNLLFTTFAR